MQNMIEPLIHFPWYRWAKAHWQGAALGIVSLGTLTRTPCCLLSEDRRHLLVFEGEIYNGRELQQALGVDDAADDAAEAHLAVVMQAMRRWGAGALARFNGLFQIAFWDARQQELIVSADRGGLRPLYFAHQNDKFAFAPEVKALLTLPWVSRELDFLGITSFLRHGLPLAGHTFFQDAQVLPPGACAIFRRGRLQIQRYWQMNFPESAQLGEKEIQRRFLETWAEVMHAQSSGDFRLGLPLSGGVDSRLIFAALVAQEKNVLTFTMGNPECRDAQIAQQLAETSGRSNLFSPVVPNEVALGLEKSVYLTDGMFNCFHANVRRLLPSLVETVNMVHDGITPLDSLYDPEDLCWRRMLRRTEPASWLHAEVDGDDIGALRLDSRTRLDLIHAEIKDRFAQTARFDFLNHFVQSTRRHQRETVALLDRFWLEEYQHRFFSFGPQLLRTAVEVRCPFFDARMLELVGILSPMQRSSDKPLQRHAIGALAPALAKIPWERTGLPLTAGFLKTHGRRVARVLRRKTHSILERQFGNSFKLQSGTKMIDYDEMIRTSPELRRRVEAILLDRWAEGSRLFNRASLQALLDHHRRGAGNHAEIIGRILTIEMWHQLFVCNTAARQSRSTPQPREHVLRMAA
jgi:asparagine synthetase B (glutamine-hydrolysing)